MNVDYDLIVIGGGAGGMSAARTGVRRGARTLMVQAGPIGGECTFAGCVPSKALIEAAANGRGFDDAMRSVRASIETIAANEDDSVFAREGVEVIHGWASFRSPTELDIDGTHFRANRFIVATGTHPAAPPIMGLTDIDYLTNENVFELATCPASLTILGGGAIGCELAQAFSRLGVKVTVIEALDRLLSRADAEASAVIANAFAVGGIDVRVNRKATRVEADQQTDAVRVHLDDGAIINSERLLVATGRQGATEQLGLVAAGVSTDRGFVVTDDHLATTASGIWAVGDVAGKAQFTHAADDMGRIAAGNALSPRWRRRRFDATAMPSVVFTAPEVAQVGIVEADAPAGARVAYLPMSEVDRAIVAGETDGFVKLIAGPRGLLRNVGGGRLLGATVVASRGGELIGEPAIAMRTGMFTGRLAQTVHAYPTWSVAIQQAAAQFFFEIGGRGARPVNSSACEVRERS